MHGGGLTDNPIEKHPVRTTERGGMHGGSSRKTNNYLVEQYPVRVRDLLDGLVDDALSLFLVQVPGDELGVHHRHHAVQTDPERRGRGEGGQRVSRGTCAIKG